MRRPIELPVAVWNAALAALWLAVGRGAAGAAIAAAHAAALALPRLFDRVEARGRGGLWRDLYPMLLMPAFWIELGLLRELLPLPYHDAGIAALDHALFGTHLSAAWVRAMPWPWLSALMEAAYASYYLAAFGLPLGLALLRKRDALQEAVLRLMATYLAAFAIYVVFPVVGPSAALPPFDDPALHDVFWRFNHAAHASGNSVGTAFPSSHVAAVSAAAVVAVRRLPPWLGALYVLDVAAIALSTVYTQNHYPVDVLGGLALAALVQAVLVPLLERDPHRQAALVPAGVPAEGG
jgi:membrane-associated phospholipid phosphatase